MLLSLTAGEMSADLGSQKLRAVPSKTTRLPKKPVPPGWFFVLVECLILRSFSGRHILECYCLMW